MSYKRQSLITDVRPPSASSTAARLISLHGMLEAALENQSDNGDALAALAALHAVPFVTAAALRAADGVAKTVGQLRRHPSTRLATAAREVRVAGQWAKNMGWTQKRSQSITPTTPSSVCNRSGSTRDDRGELTREWKRRVAETAENESSVAVTTQISRASASASASTARRPAPALTGRPPPQLSSSSSGRARRIPPDQPPRTVVRVNCAPQNRRNLVTAEKLRTFFAKKPADAAAPRDSISIGNEAGCLRHREDDHGSNYGAGDATASIARDDDDNDDDEAEWSEEPGSRPDDGYAGSSVDRDEGPRSRYVDDNDDSDRDSE